MQRHPGQPEQPVQTADLDQSTLTDPGLLRKYLIQNKDRINPAFLESIKQQLETYKHLEYIPYQQLMSILTIADPDELQEYLHNKSNLTADPRLIAMLRDEAEALKNIRNDEKIKAILDNQQLAAGAFQPVSKIKIMANDYRKIYGDEKLIQYYDNPNRLINKDRKQRDRKESGISGNVEFEKQFNTLLNKLGDWNHAAAAKAEFNKLKEVLFTSGYSGNQEDGYFSALKDKLEKMYLLLNEEKIPLEYRKTIYQELYPAIGYACSPGLPTHVKNCLNKLEFAFNAGIETWLAVLRTEHIKGYAEKLHPKIFVGDQKQFEAGYHVHTINSIIEYANQHGWNAVLDLDNVREVHKGKNIKPEHYIELKKHLERNYTIESICEYITSQIQKAIDDKIDEEKLEKITNHRTYGTREYCNWIENFIKGIFKNDVLIPTLFEMESERKGESMDTPISTKVNTAYLQGYIIQYAIKNNIIDRDYFDRNKLISKSNTAIYLPSFIPPPLDIKKERSRFERWTYLTDEDLTELLKFKIEAKHDEKGHADFKDEFISALYDHAIAFGKKETISFLHKKKFNRNELFYIAEEGEEILNSAPEARRIKYKVTSEDSKKEEEKERIVPVEYRIYDSSRLKSLDRKIYERLPEQHAILLIKQKFQNECKSNPKFMSEMALHAVEAHKPVLLKTLLELKPDLINQQYNHSFADQRGFFYISQTSLTEKAAIHGAWAPVETLLKYNASSTNALTLAIKYNRKETSRVLLKKVKSDQIKYIAAVKYAIATHEKELLDELIKPKLFFQPQELGPSYIDNAISANNPHALDALIQAGAGLEKLNGRPFWDRVLQYVEEEKAIPPQLVDVLFNYPDKLGINEPFKWGGRKVTPIEFAIDYKSSHPYYKIKLLKAGVKLSGPHITSSELPYKIFRTIYTSDLPIFTQHEEYKTYFKKTAYYSSSIPEYALIMNDFSLFNTILTNEETKKLIDLNEAGAEGKTLTQLAIEKLPVDERYINALIKAGADLKPVFKEAVEKRKHTTIHFLLHYKDKLGLNERVFPGKKTVLEFAFYDLNDSYSLFHKLFSINKIGLPPIEEKENKDEKHPSRPSLVYQILTQYSFDPYIDICLDDPNFKHYVKLKDTYGRPFIEYAALVANHFDQSRIKKILRLLEAKDINARTLEGVPAAHLYMKTLYDKETLKEFISAGADLKNPPILEFAVNKRPDCIANLLKDFKDSIGLDEKIFANKTKNVYEYAVDLPDDTLLDQLFAAKIPFPPLEKSDIKTNVDVFHKILDRDYSKYSKFLLTDKNKLPYLISKDSKNQSVHEIMLRKFDYDGLATLFTDLKEVDLNEKNSQGFSHIHTLIYLNHDKKYFNLFCCYGAKPTLEHIEYATKRNNGLYMNLLFDELASAADRTAIVELAANLRNSYLLDKFFYEARSFPLPELKDGDEKDNTIFHKIVSCDKKYLPALLDSKNIAGYLAANNIENPLLQELTLLAIRRNNKAAAEILVARLKSDDVAPIFNELKDIKNDAYNILREKKEMIDLTTQSMTALQTDIDYAPAQAATSPSSQFYCTLFSPAANDEKKGHPAALIPFTIRDAMRLIEEKLTIKIESRHIVFEKVIHQCLTNARDYKDHFGNLATLYQLAYDISQLRHDWIASKIKKDTQVLDKFKLIQTVIDTVDSKNDKPIDPELYRNRLNEDLKQVPEKEREEYRTKLNKILAFRALEMKTHDIISSYNPPDCKNVAHIVNDVYNLLENRYNPNGLFEKTSRGWFDDASTLIEALLKKIGTMEYIKNTGQKFKPH